MGQYVHEYGIIARLRCKHEHKSLQVSTAQMGLCLTAAIVLSPGVTDELCV